ncbi:hypothetical protein QBC39DRAFT_1035 [Podospora conica]|nr:hypothetical protein QBC39DRAFT_1035 [Schizothecium conicum]
MKMKQKHNHLAPLTANTYLIGISLAPTSASSPKAVGFFSVLTDSWCLPYPALSCPPGKSQTAKPSSVTKGSHVLVHLPSHFSTQTRKTQKAFSSPPSPCVPRRPGTPSNHRHAVPSSPSPRAPTRRPSIPNTWLLSVVDSVLPPLQQRRHQNHQHGPPPRAATRRRPSNHQKQPTRLHRWISAQQPSSSSMPPALDPGAPPGCVGGASVGQAQPRCNSTTGLDPTARTPSARTSASGESILTTAPQP